MPSFARVSTLTILAAAALLACSDDHDSTGHDSCGDGICGDGESSIGCSSDCSLGGTTLDLQIESCAKDLDKASIGRHLEPTLDIIRATQPLETAVRDSVNFAGDASAVLYNLSENPTGSALHAPFRFDSTAGRYHTTNTSLLGVDAALDVELHFGADYVKGTNGAIIADDFFASASYLVNPHVVSRHDFEATIEHEGPGPLVELIGLGTNPSSPFTLGYVDSTREVGRQIVKAWTSYRHAGRATDVTVDASWDRSVGRPETQPAITFARFEVATPDVAVRSANVSMSSDSGKLQGVVQLESRSAPFSYDATIELVDYYPRLTVRCPR